MTEDETLEKLDILLEVLRSQKDAIAFNRILELLKQINPDFNAKWLKMALYKLERDKFIEAELFNKDDPKANSIWLLSIEGSIFHGYIEQFSVLRTNRRLSRLQNWTLSIGTGLAGLYGLFEILKWFYHHFHWMHCLKFWT